MADPALPQALPDDPSRQTEADLARGPQIPRPSSASAREAQASPPAGEPRAQVNDHATGAKIVILETSDPLQAAERLSTNWTATER